MNKMIGRVTDSYAKQRVLEHSFTLEDAHKLSYAQYVVHNSSGKATRSNGEGI